MRVVDLIAKNEMVKFGEQEIEFLVEGITTRAIRLSSAALCMAIFFSGYGQEEISNLTLKWLIRKSLI